MFRQSRALGPEFVMKHVTGANTKHGAGAAYGACRHQKPQATDMASAAIDPVHSRHGCRAKERNAACAELELPGSVGCGIRGNASQHRRSGGAHLVKLQQPCRPARDPRRRLALKRPDAASAAHNL